MGYQTKHKPREQMVCASCGVQRMVAIAEQRSARGPRCDKCGGPMHRTFDEGRINKSAR